MASDLYNVAKVITLIDGIVAILNGLFRIVGSSIPAFGLGLIGGTLGGFLMILGGLFNVNIFLQKYKLNLKGLPLGIVVLVVSLLFTTWIGVIAGIIFIIDVFYN